MKTILVTGGAGFIGSHTCLALLQSGYRLIVIDSYINSSPYIIKRLDSLFSQNHNDFKDKFHLLKDTIKTLKVFT